LTIITIATGFFVLRRISAWLSIKIQHTNNQDEKDQED
jgi:NhaP-type Na+/H+ or K+/H+ antiporter